MYVIHIIFSSCNTINFSNFLISDSQDDNCESLKDTTNLYLDDQIVPQFLRDALMEVSLLESLQVLCSSDGC